MVVIRKRGDKARYEVRGKECIGLPCLNIHRVAIRGATSSGSRTAGYRDCCARRDHYGCPIPIPEFDMTLAKERREEGLRITA